MKFNFRIGPSGPEVECEGSTSAGRLLSFREREGVFGFRRFRVWYTDENTILSGFRICQIFKDLPEFLIEQLCKLGWCSDLALTPYNT